MSLYNAFHYFKKNFLIGLPPPFFFWGQPSPHACFHTAYQRTCEVSTSDLQFLHGFHWTVTHFCVPRVLNIILTRRVVTSWDKIFLMHVFETPVHGSGKQQRWLCCLPLSKTGQGYFVLTRLGFGVFVCGHFVTVIHCSAYALNSHVWQVVSRNLVTCLFVCEKAVSCENIAILMLC